MNYTLNQLGRAYTKRFRRLNKNILNLNNSGLLIFVEHLKYLRDTYLLTNNSTEALSKIASLNAAIEEFDAYQKSQKEFHWNNFCEFVKLNMREWLTINDSI
jgi:hypothetical protein